MGSCHEKYSGLAPKAQQVGWPPSPRSRTQHSASTHQTTDTRSQCCVQTPKRQTRARRSTKHQSLPAVLRTAASGTSVRCPGQQRASPVASSRQGRLGPATPSRAFVLKQALPRRLPTSQRSRGKAHPAFAVSRMHVALAHLPCAAGTSRPSLCLCPAPLGPSGQQPLCPGSREVR